MLIATDIIYSNPNNTSMSNKRNKLIPFINYNKPAPKRCIDMLLAKYYKQNYQSEVLMHSPEKNSIPNLKRELRDSTILLVTDGGLVPLNNPDGIPSTCSDKFGVYNIKGSMELNYRNYEVNHQGYDNSFVEENPNRLLPLDALRDIEKEGNIGSVFDYFISTTGVMCSTEQSVRMAKKIANYVSTLNVDAVMISSACGTSTRCGSYIGLAIEEKGIPVVQVTNLTRIAADTGISRIVKGNNVSYPFGDPKLSPTSEFAYRKQLVQESLKLLLTKY